MLLLVFISIFSLSDVFADIYRCVDPETGEVIFTNFKNEIFGKKCQLYIRERTKINKNRSSFYTYSIKVEWFGHKAEGHL